MLFQTFAEGVISIHYQNEKLINCGICGNPTPERLYLADDCPHCGLGVHYEADSEGSDRLWKKLLGED